MASPAGAEQYFNETLRQDQWYDFPSLDRERAINEAVKMFGGLAFSRKPPKLDFAIYEQAYCLLSKRAEDSGISEKIAMGIKSWSLDDASESYATQSEITSGPGWIDGVYFCPKALSWVKDYLQTGSIKTGRLVRRRGG